MLSYLRTESVLRTSKNNATFQDPNDHVGFSFDMTQDRTRQTFLTNSTKWETPIDPLSGIQRKKRWAILEAKADVDLLPY